MMNDDCHFHSLNQRDDKDNDQSSFVDGLSSFGADIYFEETKQSFSMKPDNVKRQGGLHPVRKKFTKGLTRMELSRSAFYIAYNLHRVSQRDLIFQKKVM